MSISPLIGSPRVATHAPTSGSSAGDHLTVKKQQKTKLVAQLKATQNDKSLDSGVKEAKVAQLTDVVVPSAMTCATNGYWNNSDSPIIRASSACMLVQAH